MSVIFLLLFLSVLDVASFSGIQNIIHWIRIQNAFVFRPCIQDFLLRTMDESCIGD